MLVRLRILQLGLHAHFLVVTGQFFEIRIVTIRKGIDLQATLSFSVLAGQKEPSKRQVLT
jgi:hypothetical protein